MPAGYVANVLNEDALVVAALKRQGVQAQRVAWCDSEVDWSQADGALFRTTWDYFDRWAEFSAWLSQTATVTSLLNAPPILHWNLDKHYLNDLKQCGCRVVPTCFVAHGDKRTWNEVVKDLEWPEVVIKPAIAGAAVNTFRVRVGSGTSFPADERSIDVLWDDLISAQDMLVQPFLPDVVESGERSLVWVDGRVTHAVTKRAKSGDFRVQDDHGGVVTPHEASPNELAFADEAMQACLSHCRAKGWPLPLYARVDMVRDLQGEWAVSELEMVEPELWFRFHPEAADVLATAVVRRLEA